MIICRDRYIGKYVEHLSGCDIICIGLKFSNKAKVEKWGVDVYFNNGTSKEENEPTDVRKRFPLKDAATESVPSLEESAMEQGRIYVIALGGYPARGAGGRSPGKNFQGHKRKSTF